MRSELAAIFGSSEPPLITIKDPLLYQFSPEPIGTILEQDPLPGAGVSEPVELALIVSKGPESEQVEMPLLTGLRLDKALELAGKSGIRWVLSSRPLKSGENSETVVEQEPAGGELIAVNRVASITVAEPDVFDLKNNEVAALFEYTLPENPYPMATTLEVIPPEGPRRTLVNVSHYGGRFTYPYRLTRGSILVLSLLNRELYRETVQ